MANHKRGRSKAQRAGCLLCKPYKRPGYSKMKASKPSDQRRMVAAQDGRSVRYR